MFIFHAIVPVLYLFWWKFYWFKKLKYLCVKYAWISIMKKQNSKENGKVEIMVVFFKYFEHHYHKFSRFQLSSKIVKEFEP